MLHGVHGAAVADMGNRSAGLAEMRAARLEFGNTPAALSTPTAMVLLEHRVALVSGNGGAAEAARWLGPRAGPTGEALLIKAWTEAAGRHEGARSAAGCSNGCDRRPAVHRLGAHLVEAEAALQADDLESGRTAFEKAITVAEPLGARPFALAGPCTQQLLSSWAERTDGAYSLSVATARAAIASDVAVPLSEREMAVLALLPSLLAREIATEFTVSVNTVKSHIRSIYAKLGVSTRREAVLHAQERGLLP